MSLHNYFPFGEEITGQLSYNTHQYTGHERDKETGLDYMLARYYEAGVGRFASVDPSRGSVDPHSPQSWNRYTYAANNPICLVDRNGKWPGVLHDQIIDKAFPGLSNQQRSLLKAVSQGVDNGQTKESNHQHAMRSPGESPEAANKAIDANIQKHEGAAQRAMGGTNPEHAKQIGQGALVEFGQALHTVTDRTSPAHTDPNGNPKVWEGIPVAPQMRQDTKEHRAEEAEMTPEQEDVAVAAAQDAFKATFGTQAAAEATNDPKKK